MTRNSFYSRPCSKAISSDSPGRSKLLSGPDTLAPHDAKGKGPRPSMQLILKRRPHLEQPRTAPAPTPTPSQQLATRKSARRVRPDQPRASRLGSARPRKPRWRCGPWPRPCWRRSPRRSAVPLAPRDASGRLGTRDRVSENERGRSFFAQMGA